MRGQEKQRERSEARSEVGSEATRGKSNPPLSLATALVVEQGVNDWILRYKSITEADLSYPWFRPLMTGLATRIVQGVGFGLKTRIIAGATISSLCLWMNIGMVYLYMVEENTEVYAVGLSVLVLVSVTLQVLASGRMRYLRTEGELSGKEMSRDLLFSFAAMKPARDAWRLAAEGKGEEIGKQIMVEEILVMNLLETVFLTVPSSILQVSAGGGGGGGGEERRTGGAKRRPYAV